MSTPLLQIEKLTVSLSKRSILEDVSLNVSTGEYVSILGPNGAGKTTLIKCIAGILQDWSGSIQLNGKPYAAYRPRERARLLAYVPQAEGRGAPLTVQEFVTLGRYPHLSPFTTISETDNRAIEAALALAELEPLRHRSLHTLSGGERQMVFIAAALAQEARLLLLDEPSTFLDYRHQVRVTALLDRVRRDQGIAILAVHHDVNTAARSSDRIHALKNGRTAFSGIPSELVNEKTLKHIYDTSFILTPGKAASVPLVTTGVTA